jgi:uncharacterized membrane protein YphA (DoxX/SURF4 family)
LVGTKYLHETFKGTLSPRSPTNGLPDRDGYPVNALLWACQILLALTFLFSGVSKSTLPVARLVINGQTGVEGLPTTMVRFIGVCELLGVIALVLPWQLGIVPILTPAAALGLGVIMVLAARVHFRRREFKTVAANLSLLSLCLVVAVGRLRDLQ